MGREDHSMIRAGALLLLLAAVAVGTSACVLAPVPGPVVAPGVVVAPRPVYIGPGYYGHYHRGHYYRGHGHRWR
jgi:hypothetical protein